MNTDRFKFRVWDRKHNSYHPSDKWFVDRDGQLWFNGAIFESGSDEDFTIEQCTGLSDKNGKLIYDGDVVIFSYFDYNGKDYHMVGIIEYEMFGLIIKGVKGEHFEDFTGYKNGEGKMYLECWLGEFNFDPENDFEIIGNIHEMEVEG